MSHSPLIGSADCAGPGFARPIQTKTAKPMLAAFLIEPPCPKLELACGFFFLIRCSRFDWLNCMSASSLCERQSSAAARRQRPRAEQSYHPNTDEHALRCTPELGGGREELPPFRKVQFPHALVAFSAQQFEIGESLGPISPLSSFNAQNFVAGGATKHLDEDFRGRRPTRILQALR